MDRDDIPPEGIPDVYVQHSGEPRYCRRQITCVSPERCTMGCETEKERLDRYCSQFNRAQPWWKDQD